VRGAAFLSALVFLAACTSTQPPAPYHDYGLDKGAGSAGIHTVLEGDTVYSVSDRYNLPMRDIIVLNSLSAPYKLSVGYRMKLPPPNEYKVREGDTLYGVARTFDVSVNQVAKLNDLSAPYTIEQGQVLRLPSPKAPPSESSFTFSREEAESASSARVGSVERENLQTGERTGGQVQQASARRPVVEKPPARSGNGKFMQPVSGRVISSYGPKKGGLHNDGINIQAPRGTPVRAAENGVVVYTGDELKGYGNLVLVRHDGGYMSAYAHLDRTLIKRGETVRRGQSIGTVGSSGQVDSPQLHFEIRRGTQALDPEKYL